MKKVKDEMRNEYDFSGKEGVRGKYAKAMKNGYSIRTYSGKKVTSEKFMSRSSRTCANIFQIQNP